MDITTQTPTLPLHLTASVCKAIPGTAEEPNILWAYASVEVQDHDGDIVRTAGIDYSDRHRADSPLKVTGVPHKYAALADPEATIPVMGMVKEFRLTTRSVKGKDVPALAFKMGWAAEADGNLTPFAAKRKSLYDAGTLDSFSVGLEPVEVKPLQGGRYDIIKSRLFEISACMIPQNPYTTVIKAVGDALSEEGVDKLAILEERMIQLFKSLRDNDQTEQMTALFKAMDKRLDQIESAIVAASEAPAGQTGDRQSPQIDPEQVKRAVQRIQEVSKRL